jgi:hypothetical protein
LANNDLLAKNGDRSGCAALRHNREVENTPAPLWMRVVGAVIVALFLAWLVTQGGHDDLIRR